MCVEPQYTNLNLSRWKPIQATALDHCPSPGAVGAANAQTCTAMVASQIQLGVPLPGHPTGDSGMIMSLSQTPCATPGACCVSGNCANWAGAHLSSLGCIHYGVLEIEAAFNIPPANGGVFFAGTYMYGGATDPSWNEIDQTFINGPYGLEFHGSLFLSNPPFQSAASEDKDVFDSTGTNCDSYVPAAGQPGNIKGNSIPYTCPIMSTTFAASYHTYKLIWTHNWLAWTVDTTVYRNSTAAPWRPVTMRPLLRTNIGTAASVAALPDAQVYVRRIRYTPLDMAGTAVTNAMACTSMAACFGNLANNAAGMLQLSSAAMVPAGRRRQLLQVGPTLNGAGAVLANPTAAAVMTPYLTELQTVSNATQYIVASVLPGVLPSQVMVSITGHTVSGTAFIGGFPFSAWSAGAQAAFVSGLAIDVVPTPDLVFVTNAQDASLAASWQNGATGPGSSKPVGAMGALVSYTVDGYACSSTSTTPCNDGGFSVASSDAALLNNIGPTNKVMTSLAAVLPTYALTITDVSPGSNMNPDWPQISAVVGVGINIFSSSNSSTPSASGGSPTDVIEAMFDSALNSGIIGAALAAANIGTASAPTNVQTMRATRAASAASGCPAWAAPVNDPFLTCPDTLKQEQMYKAVAIAFVVAFGLSILGFFGGILFMVIHGRNLDKAASRKAIPSFGEDEVKAAKGASVEVLYAGKST